MIPCRTCGRNEEFCGCEARRRALIQETMSWVLAALVAVLAVVVDYLMHA